MLESALEGLEVFPLLVQELVHLEVSPLHSQELEVPAIVPRVLPESDQESESESESEESKVSALLQMLEG